MPYRQHRDLYAAWGEDNLSYVPDFAYVYHDLQQTGREELHQVRTGFLKSMFLLMKLARNKDLLLRETGRIFGAIGNEDRNFSKTFIVYLFRVLKDKTTLMETLHSIPEPLHTTAESAYEALIHLTSALGHPNSKIEQILDESLLLGENDGSLDYLVVGCDQGYFVDVLDDFDNLGRTEA